MVNWKSPWQVQPKEGETLRVLTASTKKYCHPSIHSITLNLERNVRYLYTIHNLDLITIGDSNIGILLIIKENVKHDVLITIKVALSI